MNSLTLMVKIRLTAFYTAWNNATVCQVKKGVAADDRSESVYDSVSLRDSTDLILAILLS